MVTSVTCHKQGPRSLDFKFWFRLHHIEYLVRGSTVTNEQTMKHTHLAKCMTIIQEQGSGLQISLSNTVCVCEVIADKGTICRKLEGATCTGACCFTAFSRTPMIILEE